MIAVQTIRRRPAALWVLVCLALLILGTVMILGGRRTVPPADPDAKSPMRAFIPDSEFPAKEKEAVASE